MISKEFPYCSVLARGCGGRGGRVGVSAPGRFFHGKTLAIDRKSLGVTFNGVCYHKQSRGQPGTAGNPPTGGEYFLTALVTEHNKSCPDL